MRMLVANCSVEYQGRLGARLAPADRLVLFKADGSIAVHSDSQGLQAAELDEPAVHDRRAATA